MSRILPLITLCAVMAIIIGTFYVVAKRRTQNNLAEGPIMLYAEGDVSYKDENSPTFSKATSTIEIRNNSQVSTASGTATILLPNNSNIALGPNSKVTVRYDGKHVSIFQDLGSSYHRVFSHTRGESYEVRTGNALVSADGTKFAILYDAGTTKVGVTEHQVESSQLDGNNMDPQSINTKVVVEGKGEMIQKEGSPQIIDLADDAELELWIALNKSRDQDVNNLENSQAGDLHQALSDLFKNLLHSSPSATSETTTTPTGATSKPSSSSTVSTSTGKATSTATTSTPGTATSTSSSTPPSGTFLSKFHDLFTEYFYVDEKDTPCRFSVTPEERVGIVTNFARESGHPFVSNTLLDFANQIDAYCLPKEKDRSSELKATLKSRFGGEYPFKNS